jgi:Protein of unknown function (DUF3800)
VAAGTGRRRSVSKVLPPEAETSIAFLDESGAISQDRFFAVGCLKLAEPCILLREIQKLRDRHHWYGEIHWVDATQGSPVLLQGDRRHRGIGSYGSLRRQPSHAEHLYAVALAGPPARADHVMYFLVTPFAGSEIAAQAVAET